MNELEISQVIKRAQVLSDHGRKDLAHEQLNNLNMQGSDHACLEFLKTLYTNFTICEFERTRQGSDSDEILLRRLIDIGMETGDYENCFWDLANYLRKFYANPDSLELAEKVYEYLNAARPDLAKKLYEDYLYSARVLASEYKDFGTLRKPAGYVDSFKINLPEITGNANDLAWQDLKTGEHVADSALLVIWGDAQAEDIVYWEELNAKLQAGQFLLHLKEDGQDSSLAKLLKLLDEALLDYSFLDRVFIFHASVRVGFEMLVTLVEIQPENPVVFTPQFQFSDIEKKSPNFEKSNALIDYLSGINKRIKNEEDALYHKRASLLAAAIYLGNQRDFRVEAQEALNTLEYCDTELFWRFENRGAYIVSVPDHLVEINLSRLADEQGLYRYTDEERKTFCELYPLCKDRDRTKTYRVPLIDIYIPLFNSEEYIEEAIRSCLNQTVKDLRICISDDGSSDKSVEIVKKLQLDHPNIVLEQHANSGISVTTMKAIGLGDGLFIGQLDSDDLLMPEACETLMKELLADEYLGLAYGSCERIDAAGNHVKAEYSWPEFSREKMLSTSICHHFRMWKRKYYNRTSKFNPFIVNSIDYDFFTKLGEITNAIHVDEILYKRRWHGGNTSIRREQDQTRNTYICILNSLNRQGLRSVYPVSPTKSNPRNIKFSIVVDKATLFFFPDYSRSNPYQKLLYKGLGQDLDVFGGDIDRAILMNRNSSAPVYFHLHWLNFLFKNCQTEPEAKESVNSFLGKLEIFKGLGGKLIWTIHNNLEHDRAFLDIEVHLRKSLVQIVDKVHLHDRESVAEILEYNPVPENKIIIQEHGSYLKHYGQFSLAKKLEHLENDSRRVLFFGQIRGYKGTDRILTIAKLMADKGISITIAGQPGSSEIQENLERELGARPTVTLCLRKVSDDELHHLLLDHDIGFLAYENILTSGTLRLFQSYAIVPIAPKLPLFERELDGGDLGFLYENSLADIDNLMNWLAETSKGMLVQASMANLKIARGLSWSGDLNKYISLQ